MISVYCDSGYIWLTSVNVSCNVQDEIGAKELNHLRAFCSFSFLNFKKNPEAFFKNFTARSLPVILLNSLPSVEGIQDSFALGMVAVATTPTPAKISCFRMCFTGVHLAGNTLIMVMVIFNALLWNRWILLETVIWSVSHYDIPLDQWLPSYHCKSKTRQCIVMWNNRHILSQEGNMSDNVKLYKRTWMSLAVCVT